MLSKQPGRSSSGRGLDLLRGPTGQRQNPARPLPLASLAQNLLASSVTAQCRGKLRGVCPDMPGRLPRLSTPGSRTQLRPTRTFRIRFRDRVKVTISFTVRFRFQVRVRVRVRV